jgi:hypothetical protein
VRLADGSPVAAMKVRAFDRDLRSEQLLGEAETDPAGSYQIRYDEARFRAADRGDPKLAQYVTASIGMN